MTPSDQTELRQKLAAVEHQRWADWQNYVFSVCRQPNVRMTGGDAFGDLIIPKEYVERWLRQMATHYNDLTEREKASDMEQVDRYWPLIEAYVAAPEQTLIQRVREKLPKKIELPTALVGTGQGRGWNDALDTVTAVLAELEQSLRKEQE